MTHTSSAKVTGTTNAQILETAHLSADSIRVQDVELQEIIDNVETDGLTPAKLVQRETISENDYYILTDDTGQPVEVKLRAGVYPRMQYNTGLKYINWDVSGVTNGQNMFEACINLEVVDNNFKNLTYINLTSLENLENGSSMFKECKKLQSFNYNLPKLTNGNNMFNGCSSLEEFLIDISSVQYGYDMFQNCPKLRKFTSKLTSLTNGQWMFARSKLDKESVISIITSLKEDNICDTGSPLLYIGIDRNLATDSELLSFLGISSGTKQTITITNPKGIDWTVRLYWN